MTYKIDYSGETPRQVDQLPPLVLPAVRPALAKTSSAPWPSINLPPMAQSVALLAVFAVGFFVIEKFAPAGWRPSHLVGGYEAEIEAQVTAAKLQQQAQLDAWLEQVKLVNTQNAEQYKGAITAVTNYYQATYDRSRTYAEATAKMQGDLVRTKMQLSNQMRSPDVGLANLSRTFGLIMDAVQPGSGQEMLSYSSGLNEGVFAELDRAVMSGAVISIDGWNQGLPSPYEVERELGKIQPLPLPAPPVFSGAAPQRVENGG